MFVSIMFSGKFLGLQNVRSWAADTSFEQTVDSLGED